MIKNARSQVPAWIVCAGVMISLMMLHSTVSITKLQEAGIPQSDFKEGLSKCRESHQPDPEHYQGPRSRNPRFELGNETPAKPVLITNATLWNGDGSITLNSNIVLRNGLVVSINQEAIEGFDGEVINAKSRYVTPGLVDMHSHVGLDSWPGTEGGSDTNEMTESPLHPELRSLDGFDPWDKAIGIINSGGVTSSLVLPGSGNMMGGEAYAFKHRHLPSNRAEDMLLNAGMNSTDGHQWRWMKMACGENPIMSYGRDSKIMPDSRLGEAYLYRQRIDDAYQALKAQDQWCYEASVKQKHSQMTERYPDSLKHESLIALLRGQVLLNVHCYEVLIFK